MSAQQLIECRDLERLAQELNFELHLVQGEYCSDVVRFSLKTIPQAKP